MRPIQRTFNPAIRRGITVRLCPLPVSDATAPLMAVIEPADSEILELEGDDAATAWRDSVFISDFINAFEDSIPVS